MTKKHFLKLLSKKLAGSLSAGEEEQLQQAIHRNEAWRQIAAELAVYFQNKVEQPAATEDKLQRTWELIRKSPGMNDSPGQPGRKAILKPLFAKPALSVAAAILVLIIAGIATWLVFNPGQPPAFSTLVTTDTKVFKTLDDGTKVWLRQGSVLTYNEDFGKTKREMFLEGEAFFDVAKNKSVPLTIHAGKIDIEVKGTAFNVIAGKENTDIEVSLIRGLVEIRDHLNKDHKVLLKPMQKLIFMPGQPAGNNPFSITSLPATLQLEETKWTVDSLVFKKEKLADLVAQLERKYEVKIEIHDEDLKNKKFSGVLRDELLTEALDALKLSYPFSYTITNRLVIIKQTAL